MGGRVYCRAMSDKTTYDLELYERQYEYLEQMAKKHGLPDLHKALRCLIDYACETTEQEDTIFNEIRCLDC